MNIYLQDWLAACRQDPRSTAELLRQAECQLSDPEDEAYAEAVGILRGRFDAEVRSVVESWANHADPHRRRLAADILSECHLGAPDFREAAGRLLMEMVVRESIPEVLRALALALGHNAHPARATVLAPLATHPDAAVRQGVAYGLAGEDASAEAIAALIELSRDPDPDVRSWATFGLGSMTELNTPQLCRALLARTEDSDEETRGEAIVGLARRQDARVVAVIERELGRSDAAKLVVDAAHEFPHPSFLAGLKRLDRERWDLELVAAAIAACGGDLEARPLNR